MYDVVELLESIEIQAITPLHPGSGAIVVARMFDRWDLMKTLVFERQAHLFDPFGSTVPMRHLLARNFVDATVLQVVPTNLISNQ